MERSARITAVVTVASVFVAWGVALAAQPTQADFDACNAEAQANVSTPAASPSTSGGAASTDTGGPGGMGGSSTAGPRGTTLGGNASGGVSAGVRAAPGVGITGSIAGTPGGTSGTSGGSWSAGSGSSLPGIAAAGQNDPAYQRAYQDCLQRRGF